MTLAEKLFVRHRSFSSHTNFKSATHQSAKDHRRSSVFFKTRRLTSIIHSETTSSMSKALIDELDQKIQQMKEYTLLAHGYQNENFQYPIHVRRSHDGEKVARTLPSTFERTSRTNRPTKMPILTSSSHENKTISSNKQKRQQQTTKIEEQRIYVVPPNKSINDIDPSLQREQSFTTGPALTRLYLHRNSSSSSVTSSPSLSSLRPHSIACLSTSDDVQTESTETSSNTDQSDQRTINPLSNSSQSLINQSNSRTPIRTITQKFFSKLFHNPSKS